MKRTTGPARVNVWYPIYPADFAADTSTLNLEEVGAYVRILNAMWRFDGSVKSDTATMSNLLGCSAQKWRQIRSRMGHLLIDKDGYFSSEYLSRELVKARENQKKKQDAANVRWGNVPPPGTDEPPQEPDADAYADAMQMDMQGTMQGICPSPSPSPVSTLECEGMGGAGLRVAAGGDR